MLLRKLKNQQIELKKTKTFTNQIFQFHFHCQLMAIFVIPICDPPRENQAYCAENDF